MYLSPVDATHRNKAPSIDYAVFLFILNFKLEAFWFIGTSIRLFPHVFMSVMTF